MALKPSRLIPVLNHGSTNEKKQNRVSQNADTQKHEMIAEKPIIKPHLWEPL